jgi:hypothetical protein
MPPKGYRHMSVREEVYERLEEFARSKGLSSANDALVLLLEFAGIYSKLEYILQSGVSTLPQSGVSQGSRPPADGLEGLRGRSAVPEPTPEVLARLASKLAEREVEPDEYPGNLTAGEVLLLDRLVGEGRAVYDQGSRRWRLVGVREGG